MDMEIDTTGFVRWHLAPVGRFYIIMMVYSGRLALEPAMRVQSEASDGHQPLQQGLASTRSYLWEERSTGRLGSYTRELWVSLRYFARSLKSYLRGLLALAAPRQRSHSHRRPWCYCYCPETTQFSRSLVEPCNVDGYLEFAYILGSSLKLQDDQSLLDLVIEA
jgi:hypothetical protein